LPTYIHPELFGASAMAHTSLNSDGKIALLNLRQMQKDRQPALEKSAESKGESSDPTRDLPREILPAEFVFSPAQTALRKAA
jgi:hypothetical protein